MGTSGNRDGHRASRSALKDFTEDALTISSRQFIPKWDSSNGEGESASLNAWPRSTWRVG